MTRKSMYSGIEWIGDIPATWNVLRNKYNFNLDKTIIGIKCKDAQLLSLTKNGIKAITEEEQTGKVPASFTTYQNVSKNDIVMCLFDLDVSAVFSGISPYDGMISPAYKCFKCKEHINPKYIDYYFRTVFVDRKYKRYSKNVRYSLSSDEFMALPIVVPPLSKQQQIADFLDKKCSQIDEISKKIKEEIDILEEYKKSVITEAVTKGLDPNAEMKDSDIVWIGKIPKKWSVSEVAHYTNSRSGGTPDRLNLDYWNNGTVSWMASGEVNKVHVYETNEKITELATRNSSAKILPKNCVMVALNGQGKTKGMSAILHIEAACNQSLCAFSCKENKLHYRFLFYCFQSMYKFLRYQVGDELRDGLAASFVKKQRIPLPPINEQEEISNYLDQKYKEIDKIIAKKQQQLSILEEYKKSLIYEYVTGKKEVLYD